jgi:hypothetical protein
MNQLSQVSFAVGNSGLQNQQWPFSVSENMGAGGLRDSNRIQARQLLV